MQGCFLQRRYFYTKFSFKRKLSIKADLTSIFNQLIINILFRIV
jgi:hypothetical protein